MPATNTTKKKSSTNKSPKPVESIRGSVWKNKKKDANDLELPSGEVALVRRVGPQALVKAGVLDSMDTLTQIVQGELIPRAEGKDVAPEVDLSKLAINGDALQKLMDIADRVTLHVVLEPKVYPVPTAEDVKVWNGAHPDEAVTAPDDLRDEESIYVDEVDFEDKMYIMQYAMGGVADLATFRAQSEAALGAVGLGKGIGV